MVYVDGVKDNIGRGGKDILGGIIKGLLLGGGILKVFNYYS